MSTMTGKLVSLIVAIFMFGASHLSVEAQEEEYRLRIGDPLQVIVERHPDLSRTTKIGPDGKVILPLVGPIEAADLTMEQLKELLHSAFSEYVKRPELSVEISDQPVMVMARERGWEAFVTRVFPLQYAEAAILKDSLRGAVSGKGSVRADPETNSLIITDMAENMEALASVVRQLDIPGRERRQLLIEAQVIEVSAMVGTALGVEWFIQDPGSGDFGAGLSRAASLHTAKGLEIPAYETTTGGREGLLSSTDVSTVPLATMSDGGNIFFGKRLGDFDFQTILNALITDGEARLLARPKVVVENNREAKIEVLTRFPYRELTSSTVGPGGIFYTTKFIDYGVTLRVIPHIREDNIVNMELYPDVSFIQGESENVPIKVTRKTSTRVNVEDGTTLVIGGLLTDNKRKIIKRVPVLADVPIFGILFTTVEEVAEKIELMIFITPHILSREDAVKITEEEMAYMKERLEEAGGVVEEPGVVEVEEDSYREIR